MVIGMMLPIALLSSTLDWDVAPGLKPSSSPVAAWKLPPHEAGDDGARVLTDSLKFIPALIDHEGEVSSKSIASLHESARAIVIHRVCAGCGPGAYGVVLARIESEGNTALPVESLCTNVVNAPIRALAHLGLGRAYALSGDKTRAMIAYQDFLTLWKDAAPDIPVLKQAKAEYSNLN